MFFDSRSDVTRTYPEGGMRKARSRVISICAAMVMVANHPDVVQAEAGAPQARNTPMILAVDWNDPEIRNFIRDRTVRPPQSVSVEDEGVFSKLQLPVLAFDRLPGVINRAFAPQALPQRQRHIVTDPDNPVWYTIVDDYDGVTVTIDGDLRVQKVLPADTKIYKPPQGVGVEPEISVIDSRVEEGMEGLIAEYTVRKFPRIPYRVTIECSPATKQFCADKDALLRDREALQVISARPPT